MENQTTTEALQRLLYREFLLEPELFLEAGIENLSARLGQALACGEQEALARLGQSSTLQPLTLEQLQELLLIRDMALVSRTAAAVSAQLKDPQVPYDQCIRTALCYGVIGQYGHVFSALRAAAAKNDHYARHHHLYGLVLGIQGDRDRAAWELGMALQYEPYEDGRARIRLAVEALRG